MKKILIIVPLYKSYHLLDGFIEKIKLETKQDFKVLFVDNTDELSQSTMEKIHYDIYKKNEFDDRFQSVAEMKNGKLFRLWYSDSVNIFFDYEMEVTQFDNRYDNRFMVFNPDHYPFEENWLSKMISMWDEIKEYDDHIATLGTLQFYTEEPTSAIWHNGCFFKEESQKCHPLDWYHNFNYSPSSRWIKCDGNTGSGIMFDSEKFRELGMLDSVKYPHYSSDADYCLRATKKGYTHYCANVKTIHTPNKSSLEN